MEKIYIKWLMRQAKMYEKFGQWLNRILEKGLPEDAAATCFNLYEDTDNYWSIQLVATEYFDEEDEDWVCEELFTTGEDLFTWHEDTKWKAVLEASTALVTKYLTDGKYADKLKKYEAVGIGFVDGDVSVLYKK